MNGLQLSGREAPARVPWDSKAGAGLELRPAATPSSLPAWLNSAAWILSLGLVSVASVTFSGSLASPCLSFFICKQG